MRWLLVVLLAGCAVDTRALLTDNLEADWQGGVGATVSAGRISQWSDQHWALNNDGLTNNLTQSNTNYQPYDYIDAHGYHGVLFPWAFSSAHPNTYLNIPASLVASTINLTVYVVASGPVDQERGETLIYFNGFPAWIKFTLSGTYPQNLPASLTVGQQASTVYPPLNRAIMVGAADNFKTTIRWNNVTQTNAPQNAGTLNSGGTLAVNNSAISAGSEYGYSGVIYRVLIYTTAHTQAQMDAQVAELASDYGVVTNYTRQAVCRGDSIVEGVASTVLQSFPYQLWERCPEVKWRNQGIGSLLIGTNGDSSSMYAVDGNFVDPLYDASLQQNWLFFFGGVNDINSGVSSGAVYGRLTNYVAARKAAHPWQVAACTVQADTINNTGNALYNTYIRTNGGPWDRLADPGLNSPIETRLNNPGNLTYFYTDGLHLINAGYSVLADHFAQIINVPRRSTGFSGP